MGAQALMLKRTVQSARREGVSWREVLRHMAELGASSALLVGVGMYFFGTVMVTIAWAQARKYTGTVGVVGPAYFELILREFAPMLTALLAASRQAASTTAELGAMSVNEQVEALELSAADPLAELVAPRLIASTLTLPLLTVIGTFMSTASAVLTLTYFFQVDGTTFMDPALVDAGDILCAVTKSVVCGAFIPIAASLRGLRAKGGASAVGEAVTTGVVEACMGCLLLDFLVAAVFLIVGV
ncbi:MAG: ABC transporter permease [Archangium gephyra]|uniref:ABC transporter permease n=1 Tax=Archangium gephyra TaxID=48 RepID=A0A2W5T650_9BACT|nr:MAG: ABC transporter permease [Archangium gephyra]